MTDLSDLDTPAVTVHLDVMEDNIRRVQAHLDRHGIGNRPHIKTHKIPAIGRMQLAAGAMGITCQKIGEVEVFADAGVAPDVLLSYNILGRQKTDRLMAVSKRVHRLTVVLDNEVVARGLSEAGGRLSVTAVLATNVFERAPDAWRLCHHHASHVLGGAPDESAPETAP